MDLSRGRHAVNQAPRLLLRDLLDCALVRVSGEACVAAALIQDPLPGPVRVAAIGKAADGMMRGAIAALGDDFIQGLVIPKAGARYRPLPGNDQLRVFPASHPVPDQSSLEAGRALVEFFAAVPVEETLLLLISGGASSLAEVLAQGVGLDQLIGLNQYLLGSGLDINECNALRGRLSLIKAGGLLGYARTPRIVGMMISDVPGDDPAVIGSGLLCPGPRKPIPECVPSQWRELLAQAPDPVVCKPPERVQVIASNADARRAIVAAAIARGLVVHLPDGVLAGDALGLGGQIGEILKGGAAGLYLWGGETTVVLPSQPGHGGRNQHLALAAAMAIEGCEDVSLLACGSDGNDGPGSWAGAIVDGGTLARGARSGLEPKECLQRADSGSFLSASGDLIATGPTGTNVSDLVLGLVCAPNGELR